MTLPAAAPLSMRAMAWLTPPFAGLRRSPIEETETPCEPACRPAARVVGVRRSGCRWPTVTTKRTRTTGRPSPRHQCHPQARARRATTTTTTTISSSTGRADRRKSHLAAGHVTLMSVGIDIGSSGTQVIFSRINLRRYGEDLTSRYYVVSRETLYQSPVALTPYSEREAHRRRRARARSSTTPTRPPGSMPPKIDTGAVILTGEALRRENAQGIAKLLSEQGGEFVCATAGHHMESMLAAYGSGAVEGVARRRQAHPQHRHRRRHHQARRGREGVRHRDRGGAYRRPPAGGRRERQHRAARSGRALSRAAGRLRLAQGRRDRSEAARQRRGGHGRRAGRRADAAADAACGRAPLSHRSRSSISASIDGMHVLGRRRRICLRPREPRFRRHGPAPRPGDPPPRRCRQNAVAAAAGGRMHPRHRAGRVGIHRPALRQHQLHLQARRAAAAAEPAGDPAAVRVRGDDRRRPSSRRRSAPTSRRST